MSNEVASNARVTDEEADKAYEVGKEDGYNQAVQEIDILTGGDGEYRYCTDGDPDRHTPDATTMKQRIADRFAALSAIEPSQAPQPAPAPDGLEVVAWILDYKDGRRRFTGNDVDARVSRDQSGATTTPLVRLTDATRLLDQERAEKARLAEECQQSMGTIARERRRAEAAEARVEVLEAALRDIEDDTVLDDNGEETLSDAAHAARAALSEGEQSNG